MTRQERSKKRRSRIVVHRAHDFEDAETWDLEYWQQKSPEERLSALVALRRDVEKALQARSSSLKKDTGTS